MPTIIATGVAKPKAQGQDITKTAIAGLRAAVKSLVMINQTIKVIIEILMTAGTKIEEILSANLAIGALVVLAFSTSSIILANVVSAPTLVACIFKKPFELIVAPTTLSLIVFSTGKLSPVIALSSIKEDPSMTTPSTGTTLPGLIMTISFTTTSSTKTSTSTLSLKTIAVCGVKSINF